jgi:hypothetical protein
VQFFFCELHHLWQKLTVENTDGLIREFLSRGTDCGRAADEDGTCAVACPFEGKGVVHAFCDHASKEWMSHVEAIACDMNADFECAFLKRCPHIVYEYFHLVKNFNEKVISDVRKDEQVRLKG